MTIRATRDAVSPIFYQRCFWLFLVLLLLIAAVAFAPATDQGRLVLNGVNTFVVIATVAAVGRTTLPFVAAVLLAVPAVWFQYVGLWQDSAADLAWSWLFSAALYGVGGAYLLRYVFQPRVMTTVLTSTGFGDIVPLTRQARGVCMIEQVTGALFVAILIARLAGVYPPRETYTDAGA